MIGKIFLPMEEFIKYSSEKADEIMEMKLGEEYFTKYSFSDIDGNQCYTDEGQDIFNEIIDNVEEFLADVGIYPESEEDKKNVIPR